MPYIDLDHIDLKILNALQRDGRLTNSELSEEVGLSPSPCLRRVRRLEKDGFIKGYRAIVDREMVGLSLTVFLKIKLKDPSQESAEALQQALNEMPEVINCHMLSGTADCMAEIAATSVKSFDSLLNQKLRNLPNIGDLRSNIALQKVKSDAPIPLTHIRRSADDVRKDDPDCA